MNVALTVAWWLGAWLFIGFLVALWLGPLLKRARIEQTRPVVPGTEMRTESLPRVSSPRSSATSSPEGRDVMDAR